MVHKKLSKATGAAFMGEYLTHLEPPILPFRAIS